MEADGWIFLAQTHGNWLHLEPSLTQPRCLRNQSLGDIGQVGIQRDTRCPQSLIQDIGAHPHLLLMGIRIAQFTPHAGLSTHNINPIDFGVEGIELSPSDIDSILVSIAIAIPDIQICQIVVRQHHIIGPILQSINILGDAPPMYYVVFFDGEIDLLVGPIDGLLVAADIAPDLLLLLAIVDLQFGVVGDIVLGHPVLDGRALIKT